ncbi:MAG: tetratricopeptide repeat protein [Hormoscilla sp. SP5CHS1]|nr:tetratricopeptide repeat protein [Hormoscilla sp. SP5CHS1]
MASCNFSQYRQALAIKPDYPEAYNRMGTA